jgi:hypothetical protein
MWPACACYAFCHNPLVSCGLNKAPNAADIRRTSRAEFITMKGMDVSEAMKYLCAAPNMRSRQAPPRCWACNATVTSRLLLSRVHPAVSLAHPTVSHLRFRPGRASFC